VLEPEPRDLLMCEAVLVLFTILLERRVLWEDSAGVALVKVNVKYWISSMLHMEMIQDAWVAFEYMSFLSGVCKEPSEPCVSGANTTSTETSCTVVRARLVVLN
jgi:hypothetical protein